MNENLRLLVVGAHPADVFDQSGGTMAHHSSRGDYLGCVVLTHGARVHDEVMSDKMFHRKEVPGADELKNLMQERADVKTEEVRRACQILGRCGSAGYRTASLGSFLSRWTRSLCSATAPKHFGRDTIS